MKFLLPFFVCFSLHAQDLPFESKDFKKVGNALLEYSIFGIDVYDISYYQNEMGDKAFLILDYKLDLKKEYSVKGWDVGFEKNVQRKDYYKDAMAWLREHTPAVEDGDQVILYRESELARIYKNGKLIIEKKDNKIPEIIFRPWLGQHPVDEDVKNKLLGKE